MKIEILDVGHGQSILVIGDNGSTMLFDCGDASYRPSLYLPSIGCNGIDYFFVTNYDEDHLSDLPALRRRIPPRILYRNPSITAQQLRLLKRQNGPISLAMESLLGMLDQYTGPVTNTPIFPGTTFECFHNNYSLDFEDTNNLSLVTFLHYRDVHIVIPGDLETAGWKRLLQRQDFCEQLKTVNLFVASHHGRESGYCKEVFDYCQPALILISDEGKQYLTQEMVSTYASHASGVKWGQDTRYVLTTRSDGKITIQQSATDNCATVFYECKSPVYTPTLFAAESYYP